MMLNQLYYVLGHTDREQLQFLRSNENFPNFVERSRAPRRHPRTQVVRGARRFWGGAQPQLNVVETPVKKESAKHQSPYLKARQAIGAGVNVQREDTQ
jgi:hypothetical protein